MPPSHKPLPAPSPGDTEPIELDANLLEPDTDGIPPPASAAEPAADELPAGLAWHVSRLWAGIRPHARSVAYAAAAALAVLGSLAVRTGVRARPLARRLWASVRRRWHARRRWLWPAWPMSWPTSWPRLLKLAAVAFVTGALVVLPFALAARRAPAPAVALERPTAIAPTPGDPPDTAPRGRAATVGERPAPPAKQDLRSRGVVGRQMAREAFEQERWQDGIWYFRAARRAQRRAPDDDVLILSTIAALADPGAAPAAKRLLRELGGDARPLLVETSRSHPDQGVRDQARALLRPAPPRPFLRWLP